MRKYEFKYSHRTDVQLVIISFESNKLHSCSFVKMLPFKGKTNRQTNRKKSIFKVYGSKPVEGFDWMAGSYSVKVAISTR